MNIAFVTPEYVTEFDVFDGGLANYLRRNALSLIILGHKPIIIVGSNENSIQVQNNIEVHKVRISKKGNSSLYWIEQSYILNQYLEKLCTITRIDIIQYSSFSGIGYFRNYRVPCVVRISSFHPLLSSRYERVRDVEDFKLELIEKTGLLKSDAVYGPSKLIAKDIKDSYGIDATIIESPYIKDTFEFDYTLYNDILNGQPYFLYFGSVGLLKGCKTIADILPEFFEKYDNIKFCFIGKDAGYQGRSMMEYILHKAGKYKENVKYLDRLKHNLLFPFIENAQCLVLPSRIDNFPNTCIEAMALGKIVIGTKNTGFDQLITNGVNGFLCEADNPVSLLNSIEIVNGLTKEEKEIISANAKARIAMLSPVIKVPELIDYYKQVIDNFNLKSKLSNDEAEVHDNLILEMLQRRELEIENLIKQINDQKKHLDSLYQSRSYRLGNKLINILKFKF